MLTEKTILVTGASSGIGRETAILLAREGARLVLCDRNEADGEELARELCDGGARAVFHTLDVTDEARVAALMDAVERGGAPLTTAVNGAGVDHPMGSTADLDEAVFDRVVGVNLKGLWLCMKHEIRHMLRHGGGHIVNVASVAGLRAAPGLPLYAASKHGVVGLTRTAAIEYAREHIRVNAVCPAAIRTPMTQRHVDSEPERVERLVRQNPMKRLGEPGEVAATIAWLCSDRAAFINGETIAIDGGLSA